MSRPKKCRRICALPDNIGFTPLEKYSGQVVMTADEYEAIRLVDYEKLTQEQCALQMNVSRTTVTFIYETARFKIADAIVNGKRLTVEGGNITVCENSGNCCGICGKISCINCMKNCVKKDALKNND